MVRIKSEDEEARSAEAVARWWKGHAEELERAMRKALDMLERLRREADLRT